MKSSEYILRYKYAIGDFDLNFDVVFFVVGLRLSYFASVEINPSFLMFKIFKSFPRLHALFSMTMFFKQWFICIKVSLLAELNAIIGDKKLDFK